MTMLLGLTSYRRISTADTNNVNVVGASPSSTATARSYQLGNSIIVGNNGSTAAYLKIYDETTVPNLAVDTPKLTIMIPANSAGPLPITNGVEFQNGISIAITGGMADTDATAVGAAQVCIALFYL